MPDKTIFDFDTPVNRRGSNSYKWDSADCDGVLPMWVADMDFKTAPVIVEALQKRVAHGVFGYTHVPDEYFNATIDWEAERHGLRLDREEILYTSGVVPALSAVIKALAKLGDKILVLTPVYNCFYSSIRNNGCEVDSCPLVYADGTYHIDFESFERHASDPRTTMFLLCNPHNPACRVWTEDELRRLGDICLRYGLKVVSDDIHCELVYPPLHYTPFASLSEKFKANSVTCASPSKAFNTAGLQLANIFVSDPEWRAAIDKAININEVCDVNPFGVEALIAAYREGLSWLEALKKYLWENYDTARRFFADNFPMLTVTRLEATYLLWLDCRSLGVPSAEIEALLLDNAKVWVNAGTMYGPEGEGFIRINLACPRTVLVEGLHRIGRGLSALIQV